MVVSPLAEMKFEDLRQGMRCRIVEFSDEQGSNQRLFEMGLVPGTVFSVVKVAPFGDPVEIAFRGQRLCLRKGESKGILVELVEQTRS